MAQCCSDSSCIFTYDAEDGAPLSAYFLSIIDASINAGTGINGSHSIHSDYASSAGEYAELSWVSGTHDDLCGNPRREFAIGGYWNGKNTHDPNGFELLRVSYLDGNPPYSDADVDAATWLWLVDRVGRNIEISPYGQDTVITVANVFDLVNFPFRKIEVIGSVSTDSGKGGLPLSGNPDAWIELRVDGVPVGDGDDFEVERANKNAGITDPCAQKRATGAATGNSPRGWNVVTFGPMGDLDCIYIKDTAAYCNQREQTNTRRCAPPGPGGSSFDGVPSGPRTTQPGGFTQWTYSPPTLGGVPASASDASDAQSLASLSGGSATFSFDLTLCDGTLISLGQSAAPASGRTAVRSTVKRFGPAESALSDRMGSYRGQVWEVDIADEDGSLRGYLESATNRFYKRWQGQLFGELDMARLAGTARRSCARGRVVSVTSPEDEVIRLTMADEFSRQDSPFSLDRPMPRFLVGDLFYIGVTIACPGITFLPQTQPAKKDAEPFDNPPQNVRTEAIPVYYGEASDDYRAAENPPTTPVGICRPRLIGDVLLNGGERWQFYLASQYALKSITAMFGSNLDPDCPASVRLDLAAHTDQFLIPGLGNWSSYFATNYLDITINSVVYRFTGFFARGPISQAHVSGDVPISFNCLGTETVGDCSGTVIDDLAYVWEHFLDGPVFKQTLTGTWGALATFADGTPKVSSVSAAAVKAIHDARIAGRYRCRWILDKQRATKDHLADLLVSGNMRMYAGRHGEMRLTTLDASQALTNLTTFTDQRHIREGSFQITSERSAELENAKTYDWGPEPATGRTTGLPRPLKDAPSITNWGDTFPALDQHYAAIARQAVADDVAGREQFLTKDGITRGTMDVDLVGTDLTPGQLIRVTDFRGLGSTGWTDRLLLIESLSLNPHVNDPPQADDHTVAVRWADLAVALVAPAGMVGGGVTADGVTTSRVGFGPVGTAAGATGWAVGDAAAGNGWVVG